MIKKKKLFQYLKIKFFKHFSSIYLGESTVGNVGPPFACCMYKLIDVPSMNLEVKRDNKGEVNLFYFKII
jgi:hypothetical protein